MMPAFSYELPAERIAQRPVHPYDRAKMLVVKRSDGIIKEASFLDLATFLRPEDVLVFNNTKVFPARIFGKFSGEGGEVEVLLLERQAGDVWLCLGKPLKRFKEGRSIEFRNGLGAKVLERVSTQQVRLEFSAENGSLDDNMRSNGIMPIPPYIRKGVGDSEDIKDYQTFFAEHEGSIAAPTASLHFTPELLESIRKIGCTIEYVTLHLGTASFLPLWNDGESEASDVKRPGEEHGFFDGALLSRLKSAKQRGGRVVAVGTSVVRLLETIARQDREFSGRQKLSSDLFIEPGFEFKLVDSIVTNFHQPRTTHLLLVQAFMGKNLLKRAYDYALKNNFRFLSYGDGMVIV